MTYGLYLHIPYCRSRCRYCDFFTCGGQSAVPQVYVAALLRDFARFAPRGEDGRPLPPATVYFGGGTPGLLSPGQVAEILQTVRPAPGAEITLEVNPEGSNNEKLAGFHAAGVTRLSIGVQTARAHSLSRLGRLHTPKDAEAVFAAARRAGFGNLSGDIMMGLPGYTRNEFAETLALLQAGGAAHISAYLLKIELGTPFGKSPPAGLPSEDEAAGFYLEAVEVLERAGYIQYEISNFAQAGYESRHNLLYWDAQNWLGLGPAAHSHLCGRLYSFGRDTGAFLQDTLPLREEGEMTADDYMMLRLRLRDGLHESALLRRFGREMSQKQKALFQGLCNNGYAQIDNGAYALTAKGLLVQNTILGQLFS